MKTKKARRLLFAMALLAMPFGGCASNLGGTSGETHFVCSATSDCSVMAPDLTCIYGECQPLGGLSPTSNGTPNVEAADFPDAAAEARCANMGPCCQSLDLIFDEAHCRKAVADSFRAYDWSLIDGPIPFSGQCLEDLADTARSCTSGSTACSQARGFAVAAVHNGLGEGCSRTCTQTPGYGTSCDHNENEVMEVQGACFTNQGLYCDVESRKCTQQVGLGSHCDDPHACTSGACVEGTCVARGGEGDPCLLGRGAPCGSLLYCVSESGICESTSREGDPPCHCARLKSAGESCAVFQDCIFAICTDGKCSSEEPVTPQYFQDWECQ